MSKTWIPYAHQEGMTAHLGKRLPGRALYVGCGGGKSVVTASYVVESLFDRMDTERWLIVAPRSVAEDTWAREFSKWNHLDFVKPRLLTFEDLGMVRTVVDGRPAGLDFADKARAKELIRSRREPVQVCDYGQLQWLVKACGVNWPYDGIVFDESGFLRDADSLRFRAARKVVVGLKMVREVIELDGTPLPARYENLMAPWVLLDGGERLGASKRAFREAWSEPDVVGRSGQVFSWRVRKDRLDAIRSKIGELAISADRDIGVELVESDHEVRLPPAARAIYDRMEHTMMIELEGDVILAAHAAVKANKLLQINNGFVFDGDGKPRQIHSAKYDAIVEAVEAMDGKPVLLPYLFVEDGRTLAKRLGKRMRMAGEPGAKDQFRAGDLPVLAFHPESMAHGVDGLQGASNTVFWCGATYRFDWYHQVFKRLHRDGQKAGAVFVRRFIAADTLEARIIREVLVPRGEQNDGLLRALRLPTGGGA